MAKFETLPTIPIHPNHIQLQPPSLPELVHLNDPAKYVMTDFTQTPPHIISLEKTMDEALREMKVTKAHFLLVQNHAGYFQGIIGSEDVFGEKPIQIIQARRIPRNQISVGMVMTPCFEIMGLDMSTVEAASVGHIVKTLADNKTQYVLVISKARNSSANTIRGIFSASQIEKQLHQEIK